MYRPKWSAIEPCNSMFHKQHNSRINRDFRPVHKQDRPCPCRCITFIACLSSNGATVRYWIAILSIQRLSRLVQAICCVTNRHPRNQFTPHVNPPYGSPALICPSLLLRWHIINCVALISCRLSRYRAYRALETPLKILARSIWPLVLSHNLQTEPPVRLC